MLWDPFRKLRRPFVPHIQRKARRYLEDQGVLDLIVTGRTDEIEPVWFDLCHLHRLIRRRKPKTVLEFGIGFSTIVIAHALQANGKGHLWSVDSDQQWIDNLIPKIPESLRARITIRHSEVHAAEYDGQLCHYYDTLPNVVPEFVYLDAPATWDVKGTVRGLTFVPEDVEWRPQVSADLLLYESSLPGRFFLLIDGRKLNVEFLYRNLKRNYRVHWNRTLQFATFELVRPR